MAGSVFAPAGQGSKAKPEKTAPGCSRDSRGYGGHIGVVARNVKQQLLQCKKDRANRLR
jgi:hypothetical protein